MQNNNLSIILFLAGVSYGIVKKKPALAVLMFGLLGAGIGKIIINQKTIKP